LATCEKDDGLVHNLNVTQLLFSGAHVWVRVEGSEAVLGISDFLQDQMGEINRLELSDLGDILRAGRRMGRVESEEASSPLEAPLSGEVLEVNPEALENPDLINSDPYGAAWLLRVRIEDPRELEALIDEEDYAELTTEV
jgi:glycine cleavage system H protein